MAKHLVTIANRKIVHSLEM